MEWLKSIFSKENISEIQAYISSTDFLLQLGIIVGAIIIAKLVSAIVRSRLDRIRDRKLYKFSLDNLIEAIKNVSVPIVVLLITDVADDIMHELGGGVKLLDIATNLFGAWAVIRFFTSFMKYKIIAGWFAFVAWVIAALNIIGVLEEVTSTLDSVAIETGDTRVSILMVIQALVSLLIFLWIANALSNFFERQLSSSKLNPSLRVLFSKIIRISLIITACMFALNAIGIDLTAFAVFSGALGVGLGFGLQKIVSNFISGIILLMDRSIKPGDVIAVDQTYGWVNKLSSRHVSVITRDGKEHLIPNELLITEKVENWSYSNKDVRIKIPFGVSYDSDPHKVKELVLKAVNEMPRILKDPAPNCLLKGFGDSSVDFELRVWINDPADGVSNMKSNVYFAIWDVLQENKIEIPFPQRDVHIKSEQSTKKASSKKK